MKASNASIDEIAPHPCELVTYVMTALGWSANAGHKPVRMLDVT
jgi:hypothetical protein